MEGWVGGWEEEVEMMKGRSGGSGRRGGWEEEVEMMKGRWRWTVSITCHII